MVGMCREKFRRVIVNDEEMDINDNNNNEEWVSTMKKGTFLRRSQSQSQEESKFLPDPVNVFQHTRVQINRIRCK
jgi:hypothetical protein